jgi:hypothetical protein
MRRFLTTLATLASLALATAVVASLGTGTALGTIVQVGVAPGDVITYGGPTGVSGVVGPTGASGTSGLTGATGSTNTSPIPQCPGLPCTAITETTGFQVKVNTDKSVTTIPASGSLVAWTVTLGDPSALDVQYFDGVAGGAAEAAISVLKSGKHLNYTLVAESPTEQLLPWFGDTVQFPLATSIPVKKGEILALTVPTWAPVLAQTNYAGQTYGKYTSWRSSRQKADKGCNITSTETAQESLRSTVQYACLYQGVRLTYSALLITTP